MVLISVRGDSPITQISIHHPRLWFWCCLMLYLKLTKYSVQNTVLQESGRHVRSRTVSRNKLHPTKLKEFFTPLYKMPRIGFYFFSLFSSVTPRSTASRVSPIPFLRHCRHRWTHGSSERHGIWRRMTDGLSVSFYPIQHLRGE